MLMPNSCFLRRPASAILPNGSIVNALTKGELYLFTILIYTTSMVLSNGSQVNKGVFCQAQGQARYSGRVNEEHKNECLAAALSLFLCAD